jgi:hypothetical protein
LALASLHWNSKPLFAFLGLNLYFSWSHGDLMRMSVETWRITTLFDINEFLESGPVPDRRKHADQRFTGNAENDQHRFRFHLTRPIATFVVFFFAFFVRLLEKAIIMGI